MKIFNFLNQEKIYQLISVSRVELNPENTDSYIFNVRFQEIHSNSKIPIKNFNPSPKVSLTVDVSMARHLIHGSFWRNGERIKFKDYMTTVGLTDILFSNEAVITMSTDQFQFNPLLFKHQFIEKQPTLFSSRVVTYDLRAKQASDSSKKNYDFISIIGFEIFRYFYSGTGNYNKRLCEIGLPTSNRSFDNLFHTSKSSDENKIQILRNRDLEKSNVNDEMLTILATDKNAQTSIIRLNNELRRNNNSCGFSNMILPESKFSDITLIGIEVELIIEKVICKGFLAYAIQKCNLKNAITINKEIPKFEGQSDYNRLIHKVNFPSSSRNPLFDSNNSGNNHTKTDVGVSSDWMSDLQTGMELEIEYNDVENITPGVLDTTVISSEEELIGTSPNNGGSRTPGTSVPNYTSPLINYFTFFSEIILSLQHRLISHINSHVSCYNDSCEFTNKIESCNSAELISTLELRINVELYFVEIKCEGRYYYLIEKMPLEKYYIPRRTLIFNNNECSRIIFERNFENLKNIILNSFSYKQELLINNQILNVQRLNHDNSIEFINGVSTDLHLEKKAFAINKFAEKILLNITKIPNNGND
jgi:hypothetical protein